MKERNIILIVFLLMMIIIVYGNISSIWRLIPLAIAGGLIGWMSSKLTNAERRLSMYEENIQKSIKESASIIRRKNRG